MRAVSFAFLASSVVGIAAPCAVGSPPDVPAAPPAAGEDPLVVAERAKNLAVYEAAKGDFLLENDGRWVVIARGKIAATGGTLDAVKDAEKDAPHRFVFLVGEEGDVEGAGFFWYSPRFAGLPLLRALGLGFVDDPSGALTLKKGETAVTFRNGSPFPRVLMSLRSPGGGSVPSDERPREVLVGTVGPEMLLVPDDAARLGLERWEVPGTMTMFRGAVSCRRVLVEVSVQGLLPSATVVGAYPIVERSKIVDFARGRGRFWSWGGGGTISLMPIAGLPDGEWIVFGCDRVLGHGKTAEQAVTAADAATEFAYHRYCLRIPYDLPPARLPVGGAGPAPIDFDLRKFQPSTETLNGQRVEARMFRDDPPVFLVTKDEADAMRLEMTESPHRFRLIPSDDETTWVEARGGQAWREPPVGPDGKPVGDRRLVLVVYELPKPPK